jgi:hypothetical protein
MDIYENALVVLRICSIKTGVSLADLTGNSRLPTIMAAKWQAREELLKNTKLSRGEIMLMTGSSIKNKRIMRTKVAKKR